LLMKLSLPAVCFLFVLSGSAPGGEYPGRASFSSSDLIHEKVAGYDCFHLAKPYSAPYSAEPGTTTRVGAPALPCVQVNVALPVDAEAFDVRIKAADTALLPGEWNILPRAAPRTLGNKPAGPVFIKDRVVYGTDAYYPGVLAEKTGQWDLAGQDFVTLTLYPLQYNPVTRKLLFVESLSYEVAYHDSATPVRETYNFSDRVRAMTLKKLERLAVNPEAIELPKWNGEGSRSLPSGSYEYVVITTDAFKGEWDALLDWMTRKGMPPKLVTVEWIYSNYTNNTDEAKIREFIKEAHPTWGTTHFLLGGDTSKIPYHKKNIGGDNIPNDTYYADYDKDWKCEVYVGRACADNSTQIQTFIDKTLDYQKNPPAGFGNKVFFFAFDADSYTQSEKTKNYIENQFLPAWAVLVTEYDSEPGSHKSDSIAYLNDGQNLINHCDHCNQDVMGVGSYWHNDHIDKNDFKGLTNGDKQGLLYTLGCWALAYDYSDCIGETWVKQTSCGGHSFVGNSRYGWYSPGSTNTYSAKYDQKFFKVLWKNDCYHAGETLGESKNDYYPSDPVYQYIFTELTLMGDPAVPLWTDDPGMTVVQHSTSIGTGTQNFPITVTEAGSPVESALVCICKAPDVYEHGSTDMNGTVVFNNIDPVIPGIMDVTVTGQNLLVYEGTCLVTGTGPDLYIDAAFGSTSYNVGAHADYTVDIYNTTAIAQVSSFWSTITLPGGGTWPPSWAYFGPEPITVPPYGTIHKEYSDYIWPGVPLGWYTLNAYVGPAPTIIHEDHAPVEIL